MCKKETGLVFSCGRIHPKLPMAFRHRPLSPFQFLLGYQLPHSHGMPSHNSPAIDDWFKQCKHVWEYTHWSLEDGAVCQVIRQLTRWKTYRFNLGDWVWLNACYIGPYKILNQVNLVMYKWPNALTYLHTVDQPLISCLLAQVGHPMPNDFQHPLYHAPKHLQIDDQPADPVKTLLNSCGGKVSWS